MKRSTWNVLLATLSAGAALALGSSAALAQGTKLKFAHVYETTEPDINQGLTLGTVDIIYTGQAFAARTYPPIAIGGAPFMFRDFDHWKKYSQSELLKELMDGYYKKGGNKPLAVIYYGVRHTTANKAIVKPEDMAGMKLRVPDAPLYAMYP